MSVTGNLTTISITDDELLARYPGLVRFIPSGAQDWSSQRTAGQADALEAFRKLKEQDPARAVALDNDHWKRILVHYTAAVIFRGFGPSEENVLLTDRSEDEARRLLEGFLYRYDADDSGVIEDSYDVDEDAQRGREVRLLR